MQMQMAYDIYCILSVTHILQFIALDLLVSLV